MRSLNPYSLPFDGATYEPEQDSARLESQLHAVYSFMADLQWHTLRDIYWGIRPRCTASEPSISARLRDLRKAKWGSHIVERRRVTGGLFEYRLVV